MQISQIQICQGRKPLASRRRLHCMSPTVRCRPSTCIKAGRRGAPDAAKGRAAREPPRGPRAAWAAEVEVEGVALGSVCWETEEAWAAWICQDCCFSVGKASVDRTETGGQAWPSSSLLTQPDKRELGKQGSDKDHKLATSWSIPTGFLTTDENLNKVEFAPTLTKSYAQLLWNLHWPNHWTWALPGDSPRIKKMLSPSPLKSLLSIVYPQVTSLK